jgi:hypothetical protein
VEIRAKHLIPTGNLARKRGAVIRVGTGGSLEGQTTGHPVWLTLGEAERLLATLTVAVSEAQRAARTPPPQPPEANAAALPAA